MAFRVEIQPQAFEDIDSIADYIKAESGFAAAEKWFNGIIAGIASLREMPERCPVAHESEDLKREARTLLHGRKTRTYTIYFSIERKTRATGAVSVFHVRPWVPERVYADELRDLLDDSFDLP